MVCRRSNGAEFLYQTSLFKGVTTLGKMRQGGQRLLVGGHGFPMRRTPSRSGAGLSEVAQGLVPVLASQGVVRQPFDLLSLAIEGQDSPTLVASTAHATARTLCAHGLALPIAHSVDWCLFQALRIGNYGSVWHDTSSPNFFKMRL